MWLLFDLASQPDPNSKTSAEIVTATVTQSPPSDTGDGTAVSCQLEFNSAVIAKGTAVLREIPREPGSTLTTPAVAGTMTLAVKKK